MCIFCYKLQLQGSLKRKLVVNPTPGNIKRQNGLSDADFLDNKRMQVNEKLSVASNGNHASNGQSQATSVMMSLGSGLNRKPNSMSGSMHSGGNDMFSLTLKDIKKEPGESLSCSKHLDCQMPSDNMFQGRFGEDFDEHLMDADLQELFNELTDMSVPPMSDLELQNMINITIKQDEPFNLDIGNQNQRGTPKAFPPMDKIVIKTEYSPGLSQAPVSSPQMRTSSSGPAFSLPNTAMPTSSPVISIPQGQTHTQVSSCLNRGMPTWQEVSHAQQLKQIAANRQQHALIQQQQHNQQSNWSALSSSCPSPGSFGQEKVPRPSLRQPQYNSQMPGVPANGNQSKGMTNYVYKPNSNPQNNHMDMLMQQKSQDRNLNFINNAHSPVEQHHSSSKALFHFRPEQANQQMHSVLASQSKPSIGHYSQQQQTSAAVQQQQQDHQALQNQSLSRPPNGPMPLDQKLLLQKLQQVPGLQYSVLQLRQVRCCV